MAKQLWCVKKGGVVVAGLPEGTKYFSNKEAAKVVRNNFQGDLPKNPEVSSEWMYRVAPGPDHWRSHAT